MNRTAAAALIAFGFLSVAVVLGVLVFGVDDAATPFVTTVLGLLGIAITQLMANSKTENTDSTVKELSKDLRNGTFERLVREALIRIHQDPDNPLTINERSDDDGRGSNL